jgi:hypothetical protein
MRGTATPTISYKRSRLCVRSAAQASRGRPGSNSLWLSAQFSCPPLANLSVGDWSLGDLSESVQHLQSILASLTELARAIENMGAKLHTQVEDTTCKAVKHATELVHGSNGVVGAFVSPPLPPAPPPQSTAAGLSVKVNHRRESRLHSRPVESRRRSHHRHWQPPLPLASSPSNRTAARWWRWHLKQVWAPRQVWAPPGRLYRARRGSGVWPRTPRRRRRRGRWPRSSRHKSLPPPLTQGRRSRFRTRDIRRHPSRQTRQAQRCGYAMPRERRRRGNVNLCLPNVANSYGSGWRAKRRASPLPLLRRASCAEVERK